LFAGGASTVVDSSEEGGYIRSSFLSKTVLCERLSPIRKRPDQCVSRSASIQCLLHHFASELVRGGVTQSVGLTIPHKAAVAAELRGRVDRFLNRLLGLSIKDQVSAARLFPYPLLPRRTYRRFAFCGWHLKTSPAALVRICSGPACSVV
jgi:hypothetical protein